MIHRYRRRWLKKNLRPCPLNCKHAIVVGKNRVIGCDACGSRNPDECCTSNKFEPLYTKEELHEQFRQRIRNPEILLRDYRDIAALLWVMGGFDEDLDETVIAGVEQREKPPQQPDSSSKPDARPGNGGGGAVPEPGDLKPVDSPAGSVKRQLRTNAVSGK